MYVRSTRAFTDEQAGLNGPSGVVTLALIGTIMEILDDDGAYGNVHSSSPATETCSPGGSIMKRVLPVWSAQLGITTS